MIVTTTEEIVSPEFTTPDPTVVKRLKAAAIKTGEKWLTAFDVFARMLFVSLLVRMLKSNALGCISSVAVNSTPPATPIKR